MSNKIKKAGRPPGMRNTKNIDLDNLLTKFLSKEIPNISKYFDNLENDKERLQFIIELLPYRLPKLKAVENFNHNETPQTVVIVENLDKKQEVDKFIKFLGKQ